MTENPVAGKQRRCRFKKLGNYWGRYVNCPFLITPITLAR
ncbi:hypothetical protein AWB75_04171 [Caballeronia catudaia]|uniref:Uncharacterized protein n=1 Tax=Caballeronia catudaia TaxID=1777136 RepID=A0A158BYP2_9BURK|nr:hypothetical protein AWB75_04171 [Caballeronia catudaia]